MLPDVLIEKIIAFNLGAPNAFHHVSGGCINECYEVITTQDRFFLKYHESFDVKFFRAEADALDLLRQQNFLRIPCVLGFDSLPTGGAFLILEWLPLEVPSKPCQQALGRGLALMHQNLVSAQFGLSFDNALGATPQVNTPTKDWVSFFQTNRLQFILNKVLSRYSDPTLQTSCIKLIEKLPDFCSDTIIPSLLHGDLWGGNFAQAEQQQPVIFDPACYYGHHEAELGMMYMFGGFSKDCFAVAYHEIIPKADGFEQRNLIYQLYHVLNHYYLFGHSYRAQALSMIQNLI